MGSISYGQQPNFEFKAFNPLSDITSSKTSVLVEDSLGYMWIGTEEGLFRFDGQTLFPYFMDVNNPKSLPSNGINNLVLDRDNNLWIGTKEGIRKYNREFDSFTRLPDKSGMKSFDHKFVKTFTFDQTGQLFVAYNQVVYTYNKSEGQFDQVVKVDKGDISAMIFDDQNNLWIGNLSNGGLFCFEQKTKKLIPFLHDPLNNQSISINEIKTLVISGQTLWMGTLGRGIDTYDLTARTFKHYPFSKNLENYINSIFISRDKRAWVCTLCNLKLFNPNSDCFYDYYNNDDNPYSVGKSLQGVYEDRVGNLWNIHSFGGIRLARNHVPFKHIGENADRFWANSEKLITSMVNDGMGQFWISKHSFGIDIYNWKKRTTIRLKHDEHNPRSIPDGIIFSIFRDSKNQMWLGSYLGGLQKYNPKTKDFDSYRHNPDDPHSIACNDVRSIAEDTNGDLWLATHREGVDRYDVSEKKFYHYNKKYNNISDQYTNQVFVDSRGNLWVATVWGLCFLQKGALYFINYHYVIDDTTTISNNEIQVIYEDKLKNIWVGTNNGLNKFNYETQKFSRYSAGLKNKHIGSILSDKNNNIWVSTSTNISRFNPKTSRFINYDQNNGIMSKEFYDRSSCTDSIGNLFFGGSDGYDFFNPDSIKTEGRKPKVVLSDFKLFNKSITCLNDSQIIDRHISYAKQIFIDYFQNSITFFYQAISLTEANNIEYAYKLDGFDKNWVNAGKERTASYTNLNPDKYTFRVKARYENGDWSTNETTIQLNVRPAWWMTIWFKILLVLIILTLPVAYVTLRIKRLRLQGERLEVMVEERTNEIIRKNELLSSQALTLEENNEQLKNLNSTKNKLFSIISHDLRSPFHIILGFQSLLVRKYNEFSDNERLKMLRQLNSTSNQVYYLLENLLNWAKIQTSSIKHTPVRFNLKNVILRKSDLYWDIADVKGIVINQEIPEELFAFADVALLETAVRNLINNAIKFTPTGGSILIRARESQNMITISIIDSGVGMTANQVEALFNIEQTQSRYGTIGEKGSGLGLVLCKEFVEKNGGTITVVSQPGQGSSFIFTVPGE
jgi:signal transduction histidine kinase/ligand-binding sensor domain-containing protein